MARKLDIRAIGEGVETQANCDLLAQLNCDMAQGDYLAKPMSRSAYIAWIRRWTSQRKALGAAY